MRFNVRMKLIVFPFVSSLVTDFQTTGLDPGQVMVAYTATPLPNGVIQSSHYSLGEHRNNSGILRSQRELTRLTQTVEPLLALNRVSSIASVKTVDQNRFSTRYNMLYQVGDGEDQSLADRLWDEKQKSRYRDILFRNWRGAQSSIANFVASIGPDGTILIYGAGRWGHHKGNAAAPNKKFREECGRQYHLVITDEYMTSQTCYVCFSRLPKTIKLLDIPAENGRNFENVRGLLCCESDDCKNARYFARDLVGACDIHTVGTTLHEELPDMLRRDRMGSRPPRGYHELKV